MKVHIISPPYCYNSRLDYCTSFLIAFLTSTLFPFNPISVQQPKWHCCKGGHTMPAPCWKSSSGFKDTLIFACDALQGLGPITSLIKSFALCSWFIFIQVHCLWVPPQDFALAFPSTWNGAPTHHSPPLLMLSHLFLVFSNNLRVAFSDKSNEVTWIASGHPHSPPTNLSCLHSV